MMMEEINLLEIVERYLKGELNAEELRQFDALRKQNPELDQKVVEQTYFYHKLEHFSDWKNFKSQLLDTHHELEKEGKVSPITGKVLLLAYWRKYKKVVAVAASIAGITTLLIATTISIITRYDNRAQLQQLRLEFRKEVDSKKKELLTEVDKKFKTSKAPENSTPISGGTGFLIDGKGYLVTNAHVVRNAKSIIISNNDGEEFRASLLYIKENADIAILKINDSDFTSSGPLPYSIRKNTADLGEPLFTLGYPRNEIVYNEGYMSAKTGYNNDTVTCQIGVLANPGNSGGPVFNKNGEIIGIINTRLLQADGVVFAVTSKNILRAIDEVRKNDSTAKNLKVPSSNNTKGYERPQQIRKIQDFVFMVKSY